MARLDALINRSGTSVRARPRMPVHPGRSWSLAGVLLGLVIAFVCWAPAHWFTRPLEQLVQQRLLLSQTRGTLWSGSAQLALSAGPGSQQSVLLPGRLTWSVQPQVWPAPGLTIRLTMPCCTPTPLQLQTEINWSGIALRVQDHQSEWPASALSGLGTPWNTLQAQGRLHLETRRLEMRWAEHRLQVAGEASLSLLDLSSRLSTLRPMGSYRLQLHGNTAQAPMQVQLDTLEGRLQLQGKGQWSGERWRFEGEASAAPEHEAALSNLLNVLGQRRGNKALLTMG